MKKNIHVLTNNCSISNLVVIGDKLTLIRSNYYSKRYIELHGYQSKAMYITSDEEIKEGDWYLDIVSYKIGKSEFKLEDNGRIKKIILTTDQDLIKDDVQAIDNEFLEWFVKNPTCEYINTNYDSFEKTGNISIWEYEIIIPQEEPKQTVEEYEQQGLEKYSYELKQETLEEFAERFVSSTRLKNPKSFIFEGAKWQQKRSYSEKEVLEILDERILFIGKYGFLKESNVNWFKQFKKK